MMIRCLVDYGVSLKKGKLYKATKINKGWYALIDEMQEEYVYPPSIFEVVRNVSDMADIDEIAEESSDGIGFWNRNKQQENKRVHEFTLRVNPNNKSYYLEHPKGGYIKFDNKLNSTLQSGKLIIGSKSFFHAKNQLDFAVCKIIQEAERQTDVATLYGYEVEWLVTDDTIATQLNQLFKRNNISINAKFFPEKEML